MICKIHGELEENEIYYYHLKNGKNTVKICKKCRSKSCYKYRNSENIKKSGKSKIYSDNYYKNNKQSIQKDKKLRSKKIVADLDDYYIKRLIKRYSNIKDSNIPIELIELKRSLIKLKRLIKNKEENKAELT